MTTQPQTSTTRRSQSTTTPPTSSSAYRSANANERRDQRRAATTNVGSTHRASPLLSEQQLNKINKKIDIIRHNSLANTSPSPLLVAKYTDAADTVDVTSITRTKEYHTNSNQRPSSMTISSPTNATTHLDTSQHSHSPSARFSSSVQPSTTSQPTVPAIGLYPIHIQEYALIEDLLFVLMGIDGSYIRIVYPRALNDEDDDPMEDIQSSAPPSENDDAWDSIQYNVDPTLDASLKHLVEKLLSIATYYISVQAFVDEIGRYEYGTINHALGSAIKTFLKEYLTFIAQLEHQFNTSSSFTLQRFWFYCQEPLQMMKILHTLAMKLRHLRRSSSFGDTPEDEFEAVLEGLKTEDQGTDIQIPEKQKGGAILNVLAKRLISLSGDPKCKSIYSFLLAQASAPYFKILDSWIYHGEIRDVYNEFMVLEKRNMKKENLKEDFNDAYWEMRYTIRENAVPSFLEPLKTQILLAGKYLNVVRECGVNIAKPEDMLTAMQQTDLASDASADGRSSADEFRHRENRLSGSMYRREPPMSMEQHHVPSRNDVWAAVNGGQFVKNLEIAYKYANHTLLHLLLKEQKLVTRLGSLKHYFFLDQSDFLTSFLDLAKAELEQPAREISLTRLQSLMDLVLRNPSSVAAYDPFKEDVKVAMSPLRLIDQLLRIINVAGLDTVAAGSLPKDSRWMSSSGLLESMHQSDRSLGIPASAGGSIAGAASHESSDVLSGYDALTLDYTVTFPLSLVISRKALTKYQLLFRHLLYLKHAEDLLCATWMDQKSSIWRKRSLDPDIEKWKFRIFSLRNRMLAFVQQFAYYVTNEVLEPNWRRLEANLSKVSTVDQVLQYHSDFLDTCLKECMLTNAKLLRIYNKLMNSCVLFAAHAQRFTQLLKKLEDQHTPNVFGIPKGGQGDPQTVSLIENTNRALSKLEETFLYHMKLLIEALNHFSAIETVQFLCLVVRLDYNLFYNTSISKEGPARDRYSR
ncbi:Spc98 family-domain-containing protein [Radiomyces spectabilis]|uniref:Spc98 family-domain-containing protein n=1 Tax=Radiomyces spectabilis TaxID=64574 RepID=UPI00221F54A6|nr:Spc98 family-domain-containing protein [Radiomyces spectabilis]KAI8393950.1 Spc98 family-domain-containing protein [Radiomyces spectabilis]